MRRATPRSWSVAGVVAVALVASACASAPTATDDVAGEVLETVGDLQQETLPIGGAADPDVESERAKAGPSSPASVTAGEGAEVASALWWTAETLDGQTLEAASLGDTDVVLWMWAPWCSVCNREAPEVARALADLPDDVTLIGVAGRDEVEPMREFVAEHQLGAMTQVVDADGEIWASYGVSYQPAWVFIPRDGEASVAAGSIGYDGLFAGMKLAFGTS